MRPAEITGFLDERGVRYAVIGGVALAARGHVRSTFDLDLLTVDQSVLADAFWNELRDQVDVEVRRGDADDPLAGVVRISPWKETDIDLIVGKWGWQAEAVERAERMIVDEFETTVVRASDLVLLKLFAGGAQDVADVRALLLGAERGQIVEAVNAAVGALPGDAQELWASIRPFGS